MAFEDMVAVDTASFAGIVPPLHTGLPSAVELVGDMVAVPPSVVGVLLLVAVVVPLPPVAEVEVEVLPLAVVGVGVLLPVVHQNCHLLQHP